MKLPAKHRHRFKEMMGTLVPEEQTGRNDVAKVLSGAERIVTVGDRTTEKMLGYGIVPDVQVVDGMEGRTQRVAPEGAADTVRCYNPAGHITKDAISAILYAYSAERPVRVLVSGEEDLLLVPALAHAPDGTLLLYGQPGMGLVVVRADKLSKERARQLLGLLERDDETVAV